jgi:hypothetical protein
VVTQTFDLGQGCVTLADPALSHVPAHPLSFGGLGQFRVFRVRGTQPPGVGQGVERGSHFFRRDVTEARAHRVSRDLHGGVGAVSVTAQSRL